MSELIYLDTNVYLDYFFDRKDNLRPLGLFAQELVQKTISCSYTIICSDWVEEEIKSLKIDEEFNILKNILLRHKKIVFVTSNKEELRRARQQTHWQDALHLLLAQKAKAQYLVTRNVKDFPQKTNLFIVYPENLCFSSQTLKNSSFFVREYKEFLAHYL